MELSARLLAHELRESFSGSQINSCERDDRISSWCFFENISLCKQGVAYVVTPEKIEQAFDQVSQNSNNKNEHALSLLICLSAPPREATEHCGCDLIWHEKMISVEAGANRIQSVFAKFQQWEAELHEVANSPEGVGKLFDISLPIIKNDLRLSDQYNWIIAYRIYQNVRLPEEVISEIQEQSFRPKHMIEDGIKEAEEEGRDFITPQPALFFMKAHQTNTIHMPIYVTDDYRINLVIEANYQEVSEKDYPLIRMLATQIMRLYANTEIQKGSDYEGGSHHLLEKLLKGDSVSKLQLHSALSLLGWNAGKDEFACLCVDYTDLNEIGENRSIDPQLALCDQLLRYCRCRAFPYENYVFALVDLTQSGLTTEQIKHDLPSVIIGGTYCGISEEFDDLLEVSGRFEQAKKSLESQDKPRKGNAVLYSDAMIDVIMKSVTDTMHPEYFVPNELFSLIERDRAHNSNLFETLKAYLENNCNVAQTCRVLFLQRSGVLYRLEKLRTHLHHYDLENVDDRLKLLVSIKVIEKYRFAEKEG